MSELKFYPQMTHLKYEQYLAEYMKDKDCDTFITSDKGEVKAFDEDGDILFYLIPNVFNEEDFKLYDTLEKCAEFSLNTNRGASAGEVDITQGSWGKKDGNKAGYYKRINKYCLERQSETNPKAKYRISNPVSSNMMGYFDKVDINCRRFIKNPPKCRLTSFTNKHFDKFQAVIPYVEKISRVMKEKVPSKWTNHFNFLRNKEKIGDSVFTTLTINKNFRTAIHTDAGDFKCGIGVISCMGKFTGGDFCFPNYRLKIQLKPTDLLFANVHRHHCNTEIKGNRVSVVSYIREKYDRCDDKYNYKVIFNSENEELMDFIKKNIPVGHLYYKTTGNDMRFDDIKPYTAPFADYTPQLELNEKPDVSGLELEDWIINNFNKLYEEQMNSLTIKNNIFTINLPFKEVVSTLIEDRITPSIKLNIQSWRRLGYKVDIYSFIDLGDDIEWIDARTICNCNEKFYWVMNLCSQKKTIFIENDTMLFQSLPKKEFIFTSEFNRASEKIHNLAVFKCPMDNVFLIDTKRFLDPTSTSTENRRKFGRCIHYFALAKYVYEPNYFCKINKVYAKSLFWDYEKYKKQNRKYDIHIALKEDFNNCMGLKTNNINQSIHPNSLYQYLLDDFCAFT